VDGATYACAGTNDDTAGNERGASHVLPVTRSAGPPLVSPPSDAGLSCNGRAPQPAVSHAIALKGRHGFGA